MESQRSLTSSTSHEMDTFDAAAWWDQDLTDLVSIRKRETQQRKFYEDQMHLEASLHALKVDKEQKEKDLAELLIARRATVDRIAREEQARLDGMRAETVQEDRALLPARMREIEAYEVQLHGAGGTLPSDLTPAQLQLSEQEFAQLTNHTLYLSNLPIMPWESRTEPYSRALREDALFPKICTYALQALEEGLYTFDKDLSFNVSHPYTQCLITYHDQLQVGRWDKIDLYDFWVKVMLVALVLRPSQQNISAYAQALEKIGYYFKRTQGDVSSERVRSLNAGLSLQLFSANSHCIALHRLVLMRMAQCALYLRVLASNDDPRVVQMRDIAHQAIEECAGQFMQCPDFFGVPLLRHVAFGNRPLSFEESKIDFIIALYRLQWLGAESRAWKRGLALLGWKYLPTGYKCIDGADMSPSLVAQHKFSLRIQT